MLRCDKQIMREIMPDIIRLFRQYLVKNRQCEKEDLSFRCRFFQHWLFGLLILAGFDSLTINIHTKQNVVDFLI